MCTASDWVSYDPGAVASLSPSAVPAAVCMWGPTISRPTALAKGSSTLRRLSTNVSPTKGWKEALATNLNAGRQAELSAAVNEGEVIARRQLPNGLGEIHLGASQPLSKAVPGNGGLRLWQYASDEAASKEAAGLGKGMEAKHSMFNTGFAGAKVVCAVTKAPNTWSAADKKVALDEVASLLKEMDGAMYTGCDMNTTTADMDYLDGQCPYVLAAIANPAVCPNTATAYGVFGAVEACLGGDVAGKKLLVHGCGGVGGVVAKLLIQHGAAEVRTFDLAQDRADIAGCTNVSATAEWWEHEVDCVVPCSSSGLFTEGRVPRAATVVGATNLPFANLTAQQTAEAELTFVPEGVSSAGAVIVDSVEHYSRTSFTQAEPSELYEFTREMVRQKTGEVLRLSTRLGVPPSLVLPLAVECPTSEPIGTRYAAWAERRQVAGAVAALAQHVRQHGNASLLGASSHLKNGTASLSSAPSGAAPLRRAAARNTSSLAGAKRGLSSSAAGGDGADVIIVGAGIMGLNIAYQLRRRDPSMKITVLESAPALGAGSSGYSTGFQRAYYSFDETMGFALDGMAAYQDWQTYLRDDKAEARFTETGALWMLGYDGAQNTAMVDRLARFGVGADVLDAAELAHRFPLINSEPFPLYNDEGDELPQELPPFSAVYEHGCGHLDSSTCLTDLHRVVVRDGVDVRFNQRVSAFDLSPDGGRVTGVRMEDGRVLGGAVVVNASGPWFNKLNETANVKLSTEALPTRIQVADGWGPSGIYFMPRASNNQLVFGSVAHRFESEIVDNPDDCNPALDPDVKQDFLNCLFHRLPTLPREGEIVGFSSMYTVNQDDVHPMIGETKVAGLWACNGFSGHGFKLAPAVGSLVAQQITGLRTNEWETDVPHDFMGPYREKLTLKVKTHFA